MINNLYQSQQIYNYVNFVVNVFEVFFFTLVSRSVSLFDSSRHTKFHFTLRYFFLSSVKSILRHFHASVNS